MNGFVNIVNGFSLEDIQALQVKADDIYIGEIPPGGDVITGLVAGTTLSIAQENSTTLNRAMEGGNKNLVIPSSVGNPDDAWYTGDTVWPKANSTITFATGAKLRQHASEPLNSDQRSVMRVGEGNVTINNPHISQEGIEGYTAGTHGCLMQFGDAAAGMRVNGGILEYAATNCFNGGESDTIFDGTTFREAIEHCIYVHGGGRDSTGDPDLRPTGITFNNCTMTNPGRLASNSTLEANHIQLRSFHDVTLYNCTVLGVPQTAASQQAILASGITGLVVTDCDFTDFRTRLIWIGHYLNYYSTDATFSGCTSQGISTARIYDGNQTDVVLSYTDCTFISPLAAHRYVGTFTNCDFIPLSYYMGVRDGADATFDDCTFDASQTSYPIFFVQDAGTTATFAGDTTRVCDPTVTDWGPIPGSCP